MRSTLPLPLPRDRRKTEPCRQLSPSADCAFLGRADDTLPPMPRVTILPVDLTTDVPAGESLLAAGLEVGVSMEAGCCNCSCGPCAVEIVSGREHLTAAAPQELSVLRVHDRDPARFRLACSARLTSGDGVIRQRR